MAGLPQPVQDLLAALTQLPGIGPRSAERIALHLVQAEAGLTSRIAAAMTEARSRIQTCTNCGALTEEQPCALCTSQDRDSTIVCLVEKPVDILAVERSGAFKGRYHVLGGTLSPLDGIGPEDLRIASLEARIPREGIRELILALGTDVEGDATGHYLAQRLAGLGARITRIAHGLPAGSALDYADEITLGHALHGRRDLTA